MNEITVINIYGGPGSGKSTTAAGLFYKMKLRHMSVELVTEYAKDLVYGERIEKMLDQQEYIFAKQNHRLHRLRGKVEYVITDSPILLSTVYANKDWKCRETFRTLVRETYDSYNNVNLFLERPDTFQQYGRVHNKEESEQIDVDILNALKHYNIDFDTFQTSEKVVDFIMIKLFGEINETQT